MVHQPCPLDELSTCPRVCGFQIAITLPGLVKVQRYSPKQLLADSQRHLGHVDVLEGCSPEDEIFASDLHFHGNPACWSVSVGSLVLLETW